MDTEAIEKFISKKNIKPRTHQLKKWENEINYFLNKNISQKIIIEFLFEKDEEIKNKYINSYSTFQSIVSQFCASIKKSKKITNHKKIKKEIIKSEESEDENEEEITKNEDDKAIIKQNIASFFG